MTALATTHNRSPSPKNGWTEWRKYAGKISNSPGFGTTRQ